MAMHVLRALHESSPLRPDMASEMPQELNPPLSYSDIITKLISEDVECNISIRKLEKYFI